MMPSFSDGPMSEDYEGAANPSSDVAKAIKANQSIFGEIRRARVSLGMDQASEDPALSVPRVDSISQEALRKYDEGQNRKQAIERRDGIISGLSYQDSVDLRKWCVEKAMDLRSANGDDRQVAHFARTIEAYIRGDQR